MFVKPVEVSTLVKSFHLPINLVHIAYLATCNRTSYQHNTDIVHQEKVNTMLLLVACMPGPPTLKGIQSNYTNTINLFKKLNILKYTAS